jgi:hypothetical protein
MYGNVRLKHLRASPYPYRGRRFPNHAPQTPSQKPNTTQIYVDSAQLFELWHSRHCASRREIAQLDPYKLLKA